MAQGYFRGFSTWVKSTINAVHDLLQTEHELTLYNILRGLCDISGKGNFAGASYIFIKVYENIVCLFIN